MKTIETNLGKAVIDFATFAEAEKFQKENGGNIDLFVIENGQKTWKDAGNAFEPIRPNEEDFCEDARFVETAEELKEEVENLRDLFENEFDTDEEISNAMADIEENAKVCAEKIAELNNGEAVVIKGACEYVETISLQAMTYHCDSKTYAIGVIDID